ncbi:MAG: Coenzyme F420 hydrogenase/dehydrogenase, beta subunit C-terminal domain [Candidatus Bathyarchaeia archaeon]
MGRQIIKNVLELRKLCVGCGACISLCPYNAIYLKFENDDIVLWVDEKTCIKCGICVRFCPITQLYQVKELSIHALIGRVKAVFFGYSSNSYVRYHGASGGVATCLLLYMLDKGIVDKVLVTRFSRLLPKSEITNNKKIILDAQGSIYFKGFTLTNLRLLMDEVKKGKRMAIVGLPCQIRVLRKLFGEKLDHILFIGLVCNHVIESWYLEYVVMRFLKNSRRIIRLKPRRNGWPGSINIIFEDVSGHTIEKKIPSMSFWSYLCELGVNAPLGCFLCLDHLATEADVVLGDGWHPKFYGNKDGVSLIIVRNKRLLELIKECEDQEVLHLFPASMSDMLLAQGYHIINTILHKPLINMHKPLPIDSQSRNLVGYSATTWTISFLISLFSICIKRLSVHKFLRKIIYTPPITILLSLVNKLIYLEARKLRNKLIFNVSRNAYNTF